MNGWCLWLLIQWNNTFCFLFWIFFSNSIFKIIQFIITLNVMLVLSTGSWVVDIYGCWYREAPYFSFCFENLFLKQFKKLTTSKVHKTTKGSSFAFTFWTWCQSCLHSIQTRKSWLFHAFNITVNWSMTPYCDFASLIITLVLVLSIKLNFQEKCTHEQYQYTVVIVSYWFMSC